MSIVAPPQPPVQPPQPDPDALIKEARARQRRRRLRIAAAGGLAAGVGVGIYLLVAGGGAPKPPAASPSGAAPAVGHPASRFLIFIAPLTGATGHAAHGLELVDRHGRVLRILSTARFGTVGRWSPDGTKIAWKDPSGLRVEYADGSGARLVVPTQAACRTCQALSFLWSPDSGSLVVGSAGAEGNDLQLVPLDGAAPKILASSRVHGVFFTPAYWTPDGKWLVYSEAGTTLAYPGALERELDPATGRARTIWSTPNAQGASAPLISPSGRYWAYIKELDQYHQQLRIVDTTTRKSSIADGVNTTNLVGWSPDSRALAVIESGWHVVTVGANGTVLDQVGPGQTFFWGRNGELFVLRSKYNQVWVSEGGRREKFLFRVPRGAFVVSLDAN